MTTNRGRMLALDELVQLQTAGGFDLPAELLAGVEMPHRVSALPLPKLPDETVQRAANRLLADLERDRTPDLAGYAEQVVTAPTRAPYRTRRAPS